MTKALSRLVTSVVGNTIDQGSYVQRAYNVVFRDAGEEPTGIIGSLVDLLLAKLIARYLLGSIRRGDFLRSNIKNPTCVRN